MSAVIPQPGKFVTPELARHNCHPEWRSFWDDVQVFLPMNDFGVHDIGNLNVRRENGSDTYTWRDSGEDGSGAEFDGSADRILYDGFYNAQPENWRSLTLSAIFEVDTGADSTTNDIISWWNFSVNRRSFVITHHNNNQYFFELNGKGTTTGGTATANRTHLHATYSETSGEMRLYIDGAEVSSAGGKSGALNIAQTQPLVLASQADDSNHLDGAIYQAIICREEFDPGMVRRHYENPWGMFETRSVFNIGFVAAAAEAITADKFLSYHEQPRAESVAVPY